MKTALVLSAGGMFGAYQAGVWKALAPEFRPDIVVGASAGSLNAWAIAGNAEPDDLIGRWIDPACALLAGFRLREPWKCVFDPKPLEDRIAGLWQTYRPASEIGIVATDLLALRPRLFRNAEITPRHLAASCAVLLCYPQVRLENRLYTDGGLLDSLPLWAAAAMGAERILAIQALPQQPSRFVRAAVGGFRALAPASPARPAVPVRVISPGRSLGSLRQAVFWDESAVHRWIARGEADGRAAAREGWPSP